MDDLLKLLIFLCLVFWGRVFAAPVPEHQLGGIEHIVLIDRNHPTRPHVSEVLQRLELNERHPAVRHVYNNSAFQGFAAFVNSHCLDKLAEMSDISHVEQVARVSKGSIPHEATTLFDTRADAPWGLQRISTTSSVGGNADNLDFTYSFADKALGTGADIYVVDTGIYTENQVFGGRAKMIWSFDGDLADHDGHGTHVSGTAGGDVVGVASYANIYGVKVLGPDGGGWSSDVVAGIDRVILAHDSRRANGDDFFGSVLSMSLESTGNVLSINIAIAAAVDSGVHVVVAAGNSNEDACEESPASAGGDNGPAITVGAVNIEAERASFSNYGDCVDVYAPGVNVISAWIGGRSMIKTLTGTSMATPHVTGIVAYAMANATLANDPTLMKEWVRMTALPMSNGILLANNGVRVTQTEESLEVANADGSASARRIKRFLIELDPDMAGLSNAKKRSEEGNDLVASMFKNSLVKVDLAADKRLAER